MKKYKDLSDATQKTIIEMGIATFFSLLVITFIVSQSSSVKSESESSQQFLLKCCDKEIHRNEDVAIKVPSKYWDFERRRVGLKRGELGGDWIWVKTPNFGTDTYMGQMIPLEAGINEVKVYVGEEKKISSNKITIIPPLRAIGRK